MSLANRWPIVLLICLLGVPVSAQRTGSEFGKQELAEFHAIPHDPAPEELAENRHFLVSNEDHLEHFRADIEGIGGVFLGVGTDQNYVLAGWMKPELMILMDFDQWVVDVHHAYKLAFTHYKTPQGFLSAWDRKNRDQLLSLIKGTSMPSWRRAKVAKVFRRARGLIRKRLHFLKQKYARSNTPFFLTDNAQYAAIRGLFLSNRVVILRGDFVGRKTLNAIADTTSKYERAVRAFYLSNAEEYFNYKSVFRSATRSMYTDEKSVVLRTIHWFSDRKRKWTYIVQPAKHFKSWLNHPATRKIRHMVKRGKYRQYPDARLLVDWLPEKNGGGKNAR